MQLRSMSELHDAIGSRGTIVVSVASKADLGPLDAFDDVRFARVEPAIEAEVAATFGIGTGPALMIFRDGVGLYRRAGDHGEDQVARLLVQIRDLDMTHVKASIERERSETAVNMQRMCPAARRGPLL